jgi:hypothetical protein
MAVRVSANGWDRPDLVTSIRSHVLQLEDGVQPLEAMLYTLQLINEDPDLLPGIKLGMIAYDSCDSPAYALEQTLDIIKGTLCSRVCCMSHPPTFIFISFTS